MTIRCLVFGCDWKDHRPFHCGNEILKIQECAKCAARRIVSG